MLLALAATGVALAAPAQSPRAQQERPAETGAQRELPDASTIRERQPDAQAPAGQPEPPASVPALELPSRAPRPEPQPGAETVVLAAVDIRGATAFPLAELNALYADDLARPLTLADLEALADRIADYYRDAGFLLTRVIVAPQALDAGILRLQVVEGAIAEVRFEGEGADGLNLAGYGARIKAERPLSVATLERQLLLLEDLDGISVADSRVRAIDAEAGHFELVVTLKVDHVDLLTYLDNRGTQSVGPLELWTALGANSLLGGGERLQVGSFVVPNQPAELRYYEVAYTQPIGSQGTKLDLDLSTSESEPGAEFSGTGDRIQSTGVSVTLRHPVLRRRDETLRVAATFDYLDTREEIFGLTFVDDRLRVLRLRADYVSEAFLDATHYAGLELSQGLDLLGASDPGEPTLSRFDGRSDFTKLEGYFSRSQSFGDYIGAQLSMAGQISQDPLLSSEEFGLGGGQYGRAYNYYEISGEDGVAIAGELRVGQLFEEPSWLDSFQLYGFYDWGAVWNDNASGEFAHQTLSSAGAGIRLGLVERLSLDLQVARPLTREPFETGSNSTRFFFSLTGRF